MLASVLKLAMQRKSYSLVIACKIHPCHLKAVFILFFCDYRKAKVREKDITLVQQKPVNETKNLSATH